MNVYPFVEAEKAEQRNVVKACELLEVSRSAYYEWSKHTPSSRQLADNELAERIEKIHKASRRTYGAPRVHKALRREGTRCSRKRVAAKAADLVKRVSGRARWSSTASTSATSSATRRSRTVR